MKNIDPSEINIINYLSGEMNAEELIQFEIGISTNLYLPAIDTAGLERLSVNGYSLEP